MNRLRMIRHIKNTFSARILTYIIVSMMVVFGSFNVLFLRFQHQSLQQHAVSQGQLMAAMLAYNARLGVFAENPKTLTAPMESVLLQPEVLSAGIYTKNGRLLLRRNKTDAVPAGIAADGDADPLGQAIQQQIISTELPVFHEFDDRFVFWAPVTEAPPSFSEEALFFGKSEASKTTNGHLLGIVSLTMDKSGLHRGEQAVLWRNIAVAILFLCAAAAIVYLVVREVTSPLNRLIRKMRHTDSCMEAADDLGFLATTYDALVSRLGTTFETISELKQGLEVKVAELQQEIAERHQIEAALRESEATARALLNAPTHIAALLDHHGMILDINETMAQAFGKEIHACIGLCLWDLLDDNATTRQRRQRINQVLTEGKPLRFEDQNDGLWFDNVFHPVCDINGRVTKVAILARDITSRVLAEQERQVLEVKALAQAKQASLGEIATGIAHEINQPLSFIKVVYESTLRDLERGQLDHEELVADCQEALRQIGRITTIINHLRTFGRTDSVEYRPVWLPAVLDNSLILMGQRIKLKNIALATHLEDDLPQIRGNDIKLEQVFINLLQNSLDALSGCHPAEISVSMLRRNDHLEIRFSDTGKGVPPAIADKIFEPFFTTKDVGQGTGLGLAIVHSIIQEHRGAVHCEPLHHHQGATFVITLPIRGRDTDG